MSDAPPPPPQPVEDFWSATIAAFQPLIASPVLTEKLLQRPPFRFIHDIVSSIDARFCAYQRLFTAEDLDVAKLDSKEKKIAYLEKLIQFLALLLGRPIDVSPKKIVAGMEPDRTNAFLRDVALGVGYAQQYWQQQPPAPSAAPPPPPPPPQTDAVPPPPPPQQEDAPPPPPPPPMAADKQKLRINTNVRVIPEKDHLLKEALDFSERVKKFGIDLLQDTSQQPKISEAIRAMERELKSREQPVTEPSPMQAQSLELAIQRQIESLQQIKQLIDDNNAITGKLIEASMSTF
mmetsp:Transcript_70019/g.81643  ORF Transcript_70019/g.81643 Transcript_70019/m.81643 type:complete len:291 (-) Transcript_70019:218-1090(-)